MRQIGFSRTSWYNERTSYPTRCRDIIERIASSRYVCPHEVQLLITRIADKWDVEAGSIYQHAFSNSYSKYYTRDGVGGKSNGRGCERCNYDRAFMYTPRYKDREKQCIICLKKSIHGLECINKADLEDLHLKNGKEYCESVQMGYGICSEILDTIDRWKQSTWNRVRYRDLNFENQGIFIISKFLLRKAEDILKRRKQRGKFRKQNGQNVGGA